MRKFYVRPITIGHIYDYIDYIVINSKLNLVLVMIAVCQFCDQIIPALSNLLLNKCKSWIWVNTFYRL